MPNRLCVAWYNAVLMLLLTLTPGFAAMVNSPKTERAKGAIDRNLPGKSGPAVTPTYEKEPLDIAVGPNTLVNDRRLCPNERGLQQNETAIAASGDVVIIAFNDARGGRYACPQEYAAVGWAYSLDGGETFREGDMLPSGTKLNNGDPWLGVSPDGQTFYLSGLWSSFEGIGFYRGHADDDYVTWDEPTVISFPGETMDKEAFVVDPHSGTIYLSYTQLGPQSIKLTRSPDGGKTWLPPVVVSNGRAQGSFPIVDAEGYVYVAYTVGRQRADQQIVVSRSTDGGESFEQVVSFPMRTQNVFGMDRSPSYPQMAVDLSGGKWDGCLYVVWHALSPDNVLTPYIAHSEDGGESWSLPIEVDTDIVTADHWWPSVSVDDYGSVNVIFLDRRLNPGTARTDLFFAQSTDGGETFTNVRVTDVSGDWRQIRTDPEFTYAGDYLRAVSYGTDVYAVWPDVRNGDPDIYFSRINAAAIALRSRK